jgi:hypothetical protein
VILQEGPPGLRRRLAASHHIFAHAGFADVDAEFEEFSVDARRFPKGVVAAHLADQFASLDGYVGGDRDAHGAISMSKTSGITFGANR